MGRDPGGKGGIAVNADTIAAVGELGNATGRTEIDARGLAVSPGFINMLSWATESLLEDGRGLSDIKQGVTLEVMGEGWSMGPLTDSMKVEIVKEQADIIYEVEWTTLGEYLQYLEDKGVSPNVASFVGATTLRIHELGYEGRPPTAGELERMKALARQAMEEGALGIGSSLIYAPAFYAGTEELIELCRAAGIRLTTDMYTYVAGATGLDAAMPPWVQEGGYEAWAQRLQDPAVRTRVAEEMRTDAQDWENLYYAAGSADNLLLVGFKNDSLKLYTGKLLAEVAALRGKSPEETATDLVVEDGNRVGTVYFLMSEENVRKQIALPYMSFGSDAGALAAEGVFLKSNPHPRAYGNFARLLGKYVREEQAIPLEEAIRKLTSQPADNLKVRKGGCKNRASTPISSFLTRPPLRIRLHSRRRISMPSGCGRCLLMGCRC